MVGEVELAAILCNLILGGQAEVQHSYDVVGETRSIRVDCETPSQVIEVGFDVKRSSMDSVHQALFAAALTGKQPVVAIIDTNGIEEAVEYQIETVARMAGVTFTTYDKAFLIRYRMTEYLRNYPPPRPVYPDGTLALR